MNFAYRSRPDPRAVAALERWNARPTWEREDMTAKALFLALGALEAPAATPVLAKACARALGLPNAACKPIARQLAAMAPAIPEARRDFDRAFTMANGAQAIPWLWSPRRTPQLSNEGPEPVEDWTVPPLAPGSQSGPDS
jgi:hypothetical protein